MIKSEITQLSPSLHIFIKNFRFKFLFNWVARTKHLSLQKNRFGPDYRPRVSRLSRLNAKAETVT